MIVVALSVCFIWLLMKNDNSEWVFVCSSSTTQCDAAVAVLQQQNNISTCP